MAVRTLALWHTAAGPLRGERSVVWVWDGEMEEGTVEVGPGLLLLLENTGSFLCAPPVFLCPWPGLSGVGMREGC